MTEPVVILGAGGHAREVLDVFEAINAEQPDSFDVLGFISELEEDWLKKFNGKPVLGNFDWFSESAERSAVRVISGIGSPTVRYRMIDRCKKIGLGFVNAIHPHAVMSRWVEIGEGVVITAGVILTNQIKVGDHVHLNRQSTVGHDVILGDYCTVAPGVNISGNVHVGEGCDLGTGSSIIQKVDIGAWSVIGAGAVVSKDIPANTTSVGVPAKVIRKRKDGWWREA